MKEIQLEYLDRGLVAASTSEGVFLSWRLLGDEATGYSDKGLTGTDFNVYRDGKKIATVTDSTNYVDSAGKSSSRYEVAAVNKKGKESKRSASVKPWANGYVDIPLQKPADGVTPAGEAYTYFANDMSVGDVDGDGQYEFFVKWDPSNAKDVSQKDTPVKPILMLIPWTDNCCTGSILGSTFVQVLTIHRCSFMILTGMVKPR